MARYWQIQKDFLNYSEDFTTQGSLKILNACHGGKGRRI
jgi:hypothetical protein